MVATPSAITAPQRVVASHFFKVVLANVDILAANAQTLAASRRLREALKSCSQRHLIVIYSMPRNYWAIQPRRKLDHPNRSCRRLHGLGVAHRCTQSQECFMRVFSHAQTRLEITPYPKSARNGIRQTARETPGAPRTARPSKCAISQSKHEPEAACPYTQPQKSSAHVIWSRPKTHINIQHFLFKFIKIKIQQFCSNIYEYYNYIE